MVDVRAGGIGDNGAVFVVSHQGESFVSGPQVRIAGIRKALATRPVIRIPVLAPYEHE